MQIIKWREGYETGIPSMDDQHKKLIELINNLYLLLRDKGDSQKVTSIIEQCMEYGAGHLKDEEALLEEHNYPELVSHLSEHHEFNTKITELNAQLEQSPEKVIPEIYKFLREWWIKHIVDTDKKYGPFLQEKGVK